MLGGLSAILPSRAAADPDGPAQWIGEPMETALSAAATQYRGMIFFGLLAILITAEFIIPARRSHLSRIARWPGNGMLLVIGAILGRFLPPGALVGAALLAARYDFGLLPFLADQGLALPLWAQIGLCVVWLDFAVWAFHVGAHRSAFLWRFHRVHHADPDFDVTTALRFHPGEIILSSVYKGAWVFVLGAPVLAALAFEILLNSCAMFNHSNIKLPAQLDRALRLVIVTPDMHRMHHAQQTHHNRNFGFCLSLWDRIFVLFAMPIRDAEQLTIGLPEFAAGRDQRPIELLRQPWR